MQNTMCNARGIEVERVSVCEVGSDRAKDTQVQVQAEY